MKEFLRIILVFFLVSAIVFFSYNIYSFINGGTDNIIKIVEGNNVNIVGSLVKNDTKLEDSGISGSKYDFSVTYNPYYEVLNGNEKKVKDWMNFLNE